jgi:hypothetical protein
MGQRLWLSSNLQKFHGHGQLHDLAAFDLVTCTELSWAWP